MRPVRPHVGRTITVPDPAISPMYRSRLSVARVPSNRKIAVYARIQTAVDIRLVSSERASILLCRSRLYPAVGELTLINIIIFVLPRRHATHPLSSRVISVTPDFIRNICYSHYPSGGRSFRKDARQTHPAGYRKAKYQEHRFDKKQE